MMILATLTCLFVANSSLASGRLDNLLANSPFGQSKNGSGAPVTSNQALEFRGVSEESGQQLFSLYDSTTRRTHWVTRSTSVADIVFKSFDSGTNTITVEQQGRPLTLPLKSGPRIAQQNPVTSQPPQMQTGANGLPGLPNPPPNLTGKGPEAERLQQIAEEIRRRRALRAQSPQMPNAQPGTNSVPGQGRPQLMPYVAPTQPSSQPMPAPNSLPGLSVPQNAGPMPLPGSTSSSTVPFQQSPR